MAKKEVVLTAEQIEKRKKRLKRTKLGLSILLITLLGIFLVLSLAYNGGSFTVSLDPNLYTKSGIVIYDDEALAEYEHDKRILYAKELEFMDNISIKWLPEDINESTGGSHNGDNYLAYTFFVENRGNEVQNYWYEMYIDDVIKNVDNAVRIMVILNGEKTVYAKAAANGQAEKDTKMFYKEEQPILESREKLEPGKKDKFTVVIWLEGDDPECVDNILGGEIKVHMEINEEHIEDRSKVRDTNKTTTDNNVENKQNATNE